MSVRFAPSPTGLFHIGNFRTAWIASQWAKKMKWPLVMRFDDIDKPRNVDGAMERQLAEMKQLGIVPDEVLVQSRFRQRHWEAFISLQRAGLIYPCTCSRKEVSEAIRDSASAPHQKPAVYDGRCRRGENPAKSSHIGWRMKMPEEDGSRDFIVARSSSAWDELGVPDPSTFTPSYNWATAVDDHDGRYKLLVRAWDLEDATFQQRHVQQKLAEAEGGPLDPPSVFHSSLVTDSSGRRLEKRTRGVTLEDLLAGGHTVEGLLSAFEKSFEADMVFRAGEVWGEAGKSLMVDDVIPLRSVP